MAIARKPTKQTNAAAKPAPIADEKKVMALIGKGGSVATNGAGKGADSELVQVFFRAPGDLVEQVEAAAKSLRPIRASRQTWLLEAVVEKLQREANS